MTGTVFPAFLQLRHDPDRTAEASFLAEVDRTLGSASRRFAEFSSEANRLLDKAFTTARRPGGSLDIGAADMREAARAAQDRAKVARELATATELAARAEGDYSQRARDAIAATQAVAREAEQAARAATSHAQAVQQVQNQLDQMRSSARIITSEFLALAQAETASANSARMLEGIYRNTALQLGYTGRSARESAQAFELLFQAQDARSATAAQAFFNTALGIDATTKSARESASAFEELYATQDRLLLQARQLHGEYVALAQAEAAASQGAKMIEAIYRGTAEELGHTTKSARESAAAFAELGHEQLRGTNAHGAVITSTRASRVAFVQLGQQLTDVTVQWQMGTNAAQIFTQQVPQMAFALSGLENSANKTQARIGRMATFLAGPWGAAIFAANAVLGPFIYNLITSGDEADKSARSQRTLSEVLRDTTSSYQEVTRALDEYNRARERERDITILSLADQAKVIAGQLNEAIAIREKTKALLESHTAMLMDPTSPVDAAAVAGLAAATGLAESQLARNEADLERLRKTARETNIEIAGLMAEMQSDPEAKLKTGFEVLREEARKSITDVDELTSRLAALNRQETAALEALRESRKDATNELQKQVQLVRFMDPVEGGRVSGRYGTNRGTHRHQGIDIAAPMGTAVRAAQDGIVEFANMLGSYGNLIRLSHGSNTETRYAHLSRMAVESGQAVKQGDVIGYVGSTGRSTGPHLHYEVRVNGKAVDPATGRFPFDPARVQEIAERAANDLEKFGNRASESIARITERFDEQPRLIDQAARSTRELDRIIADLEERKPAGFEQMIADAQAAKGVIQDALVRPFEELREEAERRVEVERLLLQGRDEEAAAVEIIYSLEERLGRLSEARRDEVRDIVAERERELEALRLLRDEQNNYLDATRSVRSELEAIFSGRGSVSNFGQIFRDLKARTSVEALFGDALRDLDDWVKGSPLRDSVDYLATETGRASDAIADLADAATAGAAALSSGPAPQTFAEAFGPEFMAGLRTPETVGPDIVVTRRLESGVAGMNPERYFDLMSKRLVGPLTDELNDIFGVQFFTQLQGALSGALFGYATAGTTGGVLGGLKGLVDEFGSGIFGEKIAGSVSKGLGSALGGAQTGSMVSGLAGAFGINLSGTGSQIGGAIGSFLPIPGGEIIGSIAGGILGKLFGSTKYGTASLSGPDSMTTRGRGSGRADGAGTLGGAVQQALANIADELGAEVGAFRVSIGTYKDNYRVSTRGDTGKLGGYKGSAAEHQAKYGLYDFGDDEGAAIAFAVLDAIKDGAIKGVRASTQRLLQSGNDVEKALQEALQFEDVFRRLRRRKDPVGAELDDLDAEFERLQGLFRKAGASVEEWAQLEELYWIERDEIIKEATERSFGSLRNFLNELTIGNSALSLRDRKAAAVAEFNPLAARVEAGDASAYDDFVEAARSLLDIERQMSGSQSGYFDLLNRVTSLTQKALDGGSGTPFADRDSPFGERATGTALVNVTEAMNDNLGSKLEAINTNLGTLISQGRVIRGYSYGEVNAGW